MVPAFHITLSLVTAPLWGKYKFGVRLNSWCRNATFPSHSQIQREIYILSLSFLIILCWSFRRNIFLGYISSSFRSFHWFQFRPPSWHKRINRKADQMPRRNCWTSVIWAVKRILKAIHSVWLPFIWKPPTSSRDALKLSMAWIIYKCRAPLGKRRAVKYLAVWLLLDTGRPLLECTALSTKLFNPGLISGCWAQKR